MPPLGGMGVGAMGARAGTMSRGMASGGSGPARLAAPKLPGTSDEEAARIARDTQAAKQAEREAKQAALADMRAERAARKAEREKDRDETKDSADVDEPTAVESADDRAERPAAITVVHHAPAEEPEGPRR